MTCPNCGRSFEEDLSICPICLTPLANAYYISLPKKEKKKGSAILLLFFSVLFIGLLAAGGYFYYIQTIKTQCSSVSKQFMKSAKAMDFSAFQEEDLPTDFRQETDIRQSLSDRIDSRIDDLGLSYYLYLLDIEVDDQAIFDMISEHAEYAITDVAATYHTCDVTITCSNLNYPEMMAQMQTKLSEITEEANQENNWWMSLKEWITSILTEGEEEDSLPGTFSDWLEEYKDSGEKVSHTGKITFGIKDKHWTILSIDKDLLYYFYGFPEMEEEKE